MGELAWALQELTLRCWGGDSGQLNLPWTCVLGFSQHGGDLGPMVWESLGQLGGGEVT